jgi:hypothetical protein
MVAVRAGGFAIEISAIVDDGQSIPKLPVECFARIGSR